MSVVGSIALCLGCRDESFRHLGLAMSRPDDVERDDLPDLIAAAQALQDAADRSEEDTVTRSELLEVAQELNVESRYVEAALSQRAQQEQRRATLRRIVGGAVVLFVGVLVTAAFGLGVPIQSPVEPAVLERGAPTPERLTLPRPDAAPGSSPEPNAMSGSSTPRPTAVPDASLPDRGDLPDPAASDASKAPSSSTHLGQPSAGTSEADGAVPAEVQILGSWRLMGYRLNNAGRWQDVPAAPARDVLGEAWTFETNGRFLHRLDGDLWLGGSFTVRSTAPDDWNELVMSQVMTSFGQSRDSELAWVRRVGAHLEVRQVGSKGPSSQIHIFEAL